MKYTLLLIVGVVLLTTAAFSANILIPEGKATSIKSGINITAKSATFAYDGYSLAYFPMSIPFGTLSKTINLQSIQATMQRGSITSVYLLPVVSTKRHIKRVPYETTTRWSTIEERPDGYKIVEECHVEDNITICRDESYPVLKNKTMWHEKAGVSFKNNYYTDYTVGNPSSTLNTAQNRNYLLAIRTSPFAHGSFALRFGIGLVGG